MNSRLLSKQFSLKILGNDFTAFPPPKKKGKIKISKTINRKNSYTVHFTVNKEDVEKLNQTVKLVNKTRVIYKYDVENIKKFMQLVLANNDQLCMITNFKLEPNYK